MVIITITLDNSARGLASIHWKSNLHCQSSQTNYLMLVVCVQYSCVENENLTLATDYLIKIL